MIDEPREWAFRDRLADFEQATGIKVQIDTYGFEPLQQSDRFRRSCRQYDVVQMRARHGLFDEGLHGRHRLGEPRQR